MSSPNPDPQFIKAIKSGLAYWQERTADASESNLLQLDRYRQNIHRLLQFGLQLPATWHDTTGLILDLFILIERRGYLQEGVVLLEQARDHCPDTAPQMRFRILNRLGQLYRGARQLEKAVATHEIAAETAEQLEDRQALGRAYFNLSEDYRHLRDYEKVEKYGQAALQILREDKKSEKWLAGTLNTLGVASWGQGDLDAAAKYLNRAIPHWNPLELPTELARTLSNLAAVYRLQKRYDAALQTYREAQAILASTASEMDKIMVLLGIGGLLYEQEKYEEAEAIFRDADSPYLQQSGNVYYQAYAANNLGQALLKQNRLDEAEPYLRRSAAQWREAQDDVMLANTLTGLADLLAQQGQRSTALSHIDEALELLAKHPNDAFARSLSKTLEQKRHTLEGS
jgi:tetratricopeptide (TPR) repeat protein